MLGIGTRGVPEGMTIRKSYVPRIDDEQGALKDLSSRIGVTERMDGRSMEVVLRGSDLAEDVCIGQRCCEQVEGYLAVADFEDEV